VFLSWGFSVDKLSFLLILLSFWLFFILSFVVKKYRLNKSKFVLLKKVLLGLSGFLILAFMSKDLLGFYVFFEISLIPLIAILVGWGYQVERVQALFYLFVYTIIGSFPLLFIFLYFFLENSLVWVRFFTQAKGGWRFSQRYIMFFLCFRFFIKLPAFGLHLWLPKAHVEAPGVGSIVLAALLLKIRVYGIFRSLFILSCRLRTKRFLVVFLLWGSCVRAIVALRQRDIKSLVAYSSVSHMGGIMAGILFFKRIALKGAFIVILAHGFCSSALFFLAAIHFEISGTRQILLVRGQIVFFLGAVCWWFLFLSANFSAPPFLSLFGEIFLFIQFCLCDLVVLFLFMLGGIFVARFCFFLFSSLVHGKVSFHKRFQVEKDSAHLVLIVHLIPLLFFVLNLDILRF
jgi:NADH-ubiquinone oxidoreductase chain 4